MTSLAQLQEYLRRVQLRLRFHLAARGAAVTAALALVMTMVFVWLANQYRFAQGIVLPLRILLFAALATAIALALVVPLVKLTRRRILQVTEQRISEFQQRLLTVIEKPDDVNPLTEMLAEDTLRVANEHPLDEISDSRTVFTLLGSGVAAAAVLLWLIVAGPGYWGYGASLLWTGSAQAAKRPLYEVSVQPGNKTLRRNTGQMVVAHVEGFSARHVNLHARYGKTDKWEEVPMQPETNGPGYQFLFAALSDQVQYYVQADAAKSKTFTLAVKDLPGVKHVRVALHYPNGLGLRDEVQDPGGDIRAVEGTQADVSIETDRPLEHGSLVLDNGSKLELTKQQGNWVTARLPVSKDGSYHVAALDSGESIRISEDYFIESKKDEAPSVRILKPGADPKISPIEELPITVEATDDFGVEAMDLHFSVNGGAEQTVPLLKSKGVKEASGTTTVYTETFKLEPGDLVSYYATARDAKTTSRTDIAFAQAEPFDLKFSQSQQAGGGGGGGQQDDNNISMRQKQIIAATWNEIKTNGKAAEALKEEARFLSDTEAKLGAQAQTLSERMASREMGTANAQFQNFSKLMTEASSQMTAATALLKPEKWHDALAPEQKALQSLLRAEALFKDIQISQSQGGNGSGGGGAQRDLARMFDLELDTSKNQYEAAQSQGSSSSDADKQKEMDKALQRLQELARRQQELAQQHNQQQAMEQRWQEEQLRREAEELRKQMEQMAQNSQGQQQQGEQSSQQQKSGSQSQGGSQSQSGKAGQQSSAMQQAMKQAGNAINQAENEMRQAVGQQDAAAQRRAAAQLAQAEQLLQKALQQQAGQSLDEMANQAKQMAEAQRNIARQMKQMYGEQGPNERSEMTLESLSQPNAMPEMSDPSNARGNYFRRRYGLPTAPSHEPTNEEKALANQKDNLAQQLKQLQQQMQQQEQALAGSQPGAATQMRKALSEAEQKELALRMQKSAEWMRSGYGERNMNMEDKVTGSMEELSRDLRSAQQQLNQAKQDGAGSEKQAEMLARVQSMRQMLEQAKAGQRGQASGQQQGQGQQQGGQQPGQAGGQYAPMGGSGQPGLSRQGVQEAIGELNALRGQIGTLDRGLRANVDDSLGRLRDLNADPNKLQSIVSNDAVASLERLELELQKRMADPQQGHGARLSPAEASPEKYRDAVAEYFKKLSQNK
jgi:hypothetical protein